MIEQIRKVWQERELLWYIVKFQLKAENKNKVLGFVWSFPIVAVPYNEPEPRPSYHKMRFTDSDLITYFPQGEFTLLKKSTGADWMTIVERS